MTKKPNDYVMFLNLFSARHWSAQKLGFCSSECSDKYLEDQKIIGLHFVMNRIAFLQGILQPKIKP
jgi:hypothetical protein